MHFKRFPTWLQFCVLLFMCRKRSNARSVIILSISSCDRCLRHRAQLRALTHADIRPHRWPARNRRLNQDDTSGSCWPESPRPLRCARAADGPQHAPSSRFKGKVALAGSRRSKPFICIIPHRRLHLCGLPPSGEFA